MNKKIFKAKTSLGTYIVLGTIPFFIWIISLFAIISTIEHHNVQLLPFVIISIFIVLLFILLNGYKIEISNNLFTYRTALYKTYKFKIEDIKSIKKVYFTLGKIKRGRGIPREMIVFNDKKKEGFVINSKVFSINDLKMVYKLINKE